MVIYNGPDAVMERLGLTNENLRRVNSRIILCQLTAYGSDRGGAWSLRQGYDEVVQAADGCQVRFGDAADPLLHGTASCLDYSTGYAAAFAVALALTKRERTGVGSHVCTSLALAGQFVQLPFCFDYDGRGPWDEAQGQDVLGSDCLNRIYKTADGWIFVSIPQREVDRLIEIPELGLQHGLRQNLEALLEIAFVSRTTDEWEDPPQSPSSWCTSRLVAL